MEGRFVSLIAIIVSLISTQAQSRNWWGLDFEGFDLVNNFGKVGLTTPTAPLSFLRVQQACLASAPNNSKFAIIFDLANSTRPRSGNNKKSATLSADTFNDFIEAVKKDIKNDQFYLGILVGSKIRYFKEPSEPTTTTVVTKALTTTVANLRLEMKGNETNNGAVTEITEITPNYNRKTGSTRPTKSISTRPTTKKPVLQSIFKAALTAHSMGVPIGDMAEAPSSLTFAVVITDGIQKTAPAQMPTGQRLIIDIDGQWLTETAVNYTGKDVIILDRNDLEDQLDMLVKTVRYLMCNNAGKSTTK